MKTFREIRNRITEAMYKGGDFDESLFSGDSKKFLGAAKKYTSEFQFGNQSDVSQALFEWQYENGMLNPDSSIDLNPRTFDKTIKSLSKLKSFGATHIFCRRDAKKGDKEREVSSIRFKGKNDKIALGLKKYFGNTSDPDPVFGSGDDFGPGGGSIVGSLALGNDKFNNDSNKLVKKYGTSKTVEWKKQSSSEADVYTQQEICIIEL